MSRAASLAARLHAKQQARATLQKKYAAATTAPLVGVCRTAADAALLAALDEALAALPIVVVALTPDQDWQGYDMLLLPGFDLTHTKTHAKKALAAGAVPVLFESAAPRGVCIDYDPRSEEGTSFLAKQESAWSLFAALTRATETFRLPYDWQGVVRGGLQTQLHD